MGRGKGKRRLAERDEVKLRLARACQSENYDNEVGNSPLLISLTPHFRTPHFLTPHFPFACPAGYGVKRSKLNFCHKQK
jgi:hypothetical protein